MATIDTTKRIRWAVVGAGNIAQVAVLPAFEHARENSELAAIVSGDPAKLAELGKRHRVRTATYDQFDELLAKGGIDAVYVALPNTKHRDFTERAARAGVHVLCEKPMATTEEDCEAMIRATRDAKVKLMIAYRLHFEEATLAAIDAVRDGVLGEARVFSSVFTQQVRAGDIRTRADVGGGALLDLGVYPINAARNLFGAEPIEAFAYTIGGEVDDATIAVLRFPNDRVAQITVHQGLAGVQTYRVCGTDGDLRVEPSFGYDTALVHHLTKDGRTTVRTFERRDQFAPELVYFARCILQGTEPEPSGEEGLADVRVCRALLASARSGRPVTLPPFVRARRPDASMAMFVPPPRSVEPVRAPAPTK